MVIKNLIRTLFVIATFYQLSCSDDEVKKEEDSRITLELVTEEFSSTTITVKNFSLLAAKEMENDGKKYYNFEYSFEIHNTGSEPIELANWAVQNYVVEGAKRYGAAGTSLKGITIAPGGKYLLTYSANSGQLEDGLAVDDLILQIDVYQDNHTQFITLDYQIKVKD